MGVFHEKLNISRDKNQITCDMPLPSNLSYIPDPEMDAALKERMEKEFCK